MKSIVCAECGKGIKWHVNPPEIIFWRPGDQPIGLHKKCDKLYNEGGLSADVKVQEASRVQGEDKALWKM